MTHAAVDIMLPEVEQLLDQHDRDTLSMWEDYVVHGMTMVQIGKKHGVPPQSVSSRFNTLRKLLGTETVDEARRKDIARIEAMIDRQWEKAIASGESEATKLILSMIKARATILGYAAPIKVQHEGEIVHDVTPELAGFLAKLRERNQALREDQVVRAELTRTTEPDTEVEVVDVDSD